MTGPSVLVTDGHLRPSLAAVRSLGRAGYRVHVCAPRARSLAGASRYAVAHERVPDPLAQPDAYADAVKRLLERWSIRVLLPMSEESLLVLLPATAEMSDVCVPFAPLSTFEKASNKEYVLSLAATLGIAVPEQRVLSSPEALASIDVGALHFPVVLKPARSVAGAQGERTKLGVSYAADAADLKRRIDALAASAFPLLLQQKIEGLGTGVFLLVWGGELLAQFAHRRIREKPPSGGASVLAESIAADPEAIAQSLSLLSALNWRGPAMVEYKQDRATGKRYLMEINGRFWGSLQLAIDAGVDFPALLVAAALGARPTPVASYDVGVRGRWWWGEVDHFIARMRGGAEVAGLGGRADAVRQFLLPGRNVRNEVLRADDPWPFARETVEWFRRR